MSMRLHGAYIHKAPSASKTVVLQLPRNWRLLAKCHPLIPGVRFKLYPEESDAVTFAIWGRDTELLRRRPIALRASAIASLVSAVLFLVATYATGAPRNLRANAARLSRNWCLVNRVLVTSSRCGQYPTGCGSCHN